MKINKPFSIIILLLSVWVFVMFAVVTGVAQLGWSQNIDHYKEKLTPWIFSSIEFFLSYGIIFQAVVIVLLDVVLLSGETKSKKVINP